MDIKSLEIILIKKSLEIIYYIFIVQFDQIYIIEYQIHGLFTNKKKV